jgi:drug/metabolite transporter (DMT)-like permease
MIRYLNSPLKVAGILLFLGGVLLLTLNNSFYSLMGISILMMGLIVLVTEWMIQKSLVKNKRRFAFEVFLICIIGLFAIFILLDFLGIISLQHFM